MLKLELHNNGVVTENFEIISSVTSQTEYINYNKYTDPMSSSIAYIESETQSPTKNLNITDLSWHVPKNNPNFLSEFERNESNFVFKSNHRDLLITTVENQNEPLYYKHKRKFIRPPEITVSKYGEDLWSDDVYLNGWRYVNGYFYSNYKNKFDYDSGSYLLYFITGTPEGGDSAVTELLSNVEAIEESSWRDVNVETGLIEVSGYTKNQIGSGFEFNVFVKREECTNEENPIFVKMQDSNNIKILPPESLNQKDPWLIRIQNGFFYDGKKYWIPEYDDQNFNPEYGIVKMHRKESYIVGQEELSTIIKLPVKNCAFNKNTGLHLSIEILNEKEDIIDNYTTNENQFNDSNSPWEEIKISVDEEGGFVQLDKTLLAKNKILVTFFCATKDLIYRGIDFNPTNNKKILDSRYYFYLIPNKSVTEKAVQWLRLDKDNIIEDASEEEFKFKHFDNVQDARIFADMFTNYDSTSDAVGNSLILVGKPLSEFEETYVRSNEKYLKIGEVSYDETVYVDELFTQDIRVKNPVNKLKFDDFLQKNWRVLQSEYGYGEEGQVFQNNNIIYIKLPLELLKDYGGEYTEDELYELFKLKTSPALEIIFDWTMYKPRISFIALNQTSVDQQASDNTSTRKIEIEIVGPGKYQLYRNEIGTFGDDDLPIETFNLTVDEIVSSSNPNVTIRDNKIIYTNRNLEFNTNYYYRCIYNDIYISDTIGLKTRGG